MLHILLIDSHNIITSCKVLVILVGIMELDYSKNNCQKQ